MDCPYCGKICQDHYPDSCDFNPDVQRKMKDLIGLTFKVQNLYVRITEVVPGMEKPIMATILTYEKKNDELTASIQIAKLHYASTVGWEYNVSEEYEDMANKLIEDIRRSMI